MSGNVQRSHVGGCKTGAVYKVVALAVGWVHIPEWDKIPELAESEVAPTSRGLCGCTPSGFGAKRGSNPESLVLSTTFERHLETV